MLLYLDIRVEIVLITVGVFNIFVVFWREAWLELEIESCPGRCLVLSGWERNPKKRMLFKSQWKIVSRKSHFHELTPWLTFMNAVWLGVRGLKSTNGQRLQILMLNFNQQLYVFVFQEVNSRLWCDLNRAKINFFSTTYSNYVNLACVCSKYVFFTSGRAPFLNLHFTSRLTLKETQSENWFERARSILFKRDFDFLSSWILKPNPNHT